MREGMFTGKKLADFNFPQDLDNPPRTNPRRIVNGADGSDDNVRTHHMVFAAALEAAGWQQARTVHGFRYGGRSAAPVATPVVPPAPAPTADTPGFWDTIAAIIRSVFGGKK